ncbi:MAG: hypothetical protein WBB25_02140 [Sulfitobacter sp.]
MPSLLITQDSGLTGPLYGDWNDADKRQKGQVFAGEALLKSFKAPSTDPEQIVRTTIGDVLAGKYSIWLRYDGEENESFAVITDFLDESLDDEEQRLAPFVGGQIKLTYYKLEVVAEGSPIKLDGGPEKLTLVVQLDTPPKDKKKKKMNVVVPSDYALFDDVTLDRKKYLRAMTEDIEALVEPADDISYLLSSLTFRRCL